MSKLKMPKRLLRVDDLICNLHKNFTAEKDNGGPLKPVVSVHERVCTAFGINDSKLK